LKEDDDEARQIRWGAGDRHPAGAGGRRDDRGRVPQARPRF